MSEEFFCLGASQRLETAAQNSQFSSISWRESVDEVSFQTKSCDKNTLRHQWHLLSRVPLTRDKDPAVSLTNKSLTSILASLAKLLKGLSVGKKQREDRASPLPNDWAPNEAAAWCTATRMQNLT